MFLNIEIDLPEAMISFFTDWKIGWEAHECFFTLKFLASRKFRLQSYYDF